MWGNFQFYLDVIEANLSRKVDRAGLRCMIHWERSYWFSTSGQCFAGFGFLLELKNGFTAHSRIANTIDNHSHPPSKPRASLLTQLRKGGKEENRDKTKIGVGTSLTVKDWETNEDIREGKSRRIRKNLVGLYYLSHSPSVLALYHFW